MGKYRREKKKLGVQKGPAVKDDNPHRHRTFNQRVRELAVNVNHKFDDYIGDEEVEKDVALGARSSGGDVQMIGEMEAEEDEVPNFDTHFSEVMHKYRSDNITAEWQRCCFLLRPLVEDLRSVLVNVDRIIEIFLEHTTHVDSVEPVCMCLGAGLARDIKRKNNLTIS